MANRILGKTHISGGAHNRVILEYTVTTNNETTYTLSITVKYRYYRDSSAGIIDINIPVVTVTGSGHTSKDSGTKSINYKTTTQETTYISTFSWSWTKGHAPQTITVTAYNQNYGSAYAAKVSLTVPERKYYDVSYRTNSGTGTIAGQKKYHEQDLTLTTSKPSKSGYTFKGWAISEAKAKTGEATYPVGQTNTYKGNAALTLWAVWEVIYQKPTIKITSIERCNQNGSANDEGEWAKVVFNWSVFKSSPKYYNGSDTGYSANVGKTVVITVGSINETVTLSGQSGSNVSQVIGASENKPFNKDTTYTLSAKITDNYSDYTVSGKIGTAEFPLDFNGNATALGIFRSAPDDAEGIYFGKMPKFVNGIPNTNTYYGATREDNTNSPVYFGIGSGGVNRGIWVDNIKGAVDAADDSGGWLIYADGNGIIHTFADYEGSIASSITNSWGTSTVSGASITAAYATRRGNVVQLLLSVKNNNAVAGGSNWFEGTVAAAWRPKNSTVFGASYYGTRTTVASLGSNGHLTIRNASTSAVSAKSSSETSDHVISVSITYIVD